MQRERKAQSAIEFLSTYSFVFLIIALVLVLLFALSYVPTKAVSAQCATYGGFSCSDAILYSNSVTGNTLLKIVPTDAQPGVLSIGGFNAKINSISTVIGSCSSNTLVSALLPGNTVTCSASFNAVTSIGSTYYGTFNVTANYCSNGVSNVSNTLCPSGRSYIYGGSLVLQAQHP